jgi:hypothetical protein
MSFGPFQGQSKEGVWLGYGHNPLEVYMFRKIVTTSILAVVLTGSVVSLLPANAATKISNGVLCPKANKTVKVSGTIYKCTKNPIVNKKKLTWVSSDCINSNKTYAKLNASYKSLVVGLPAVLADLDAKIVAQQTKETESIAKADALDAQIVIWQAKVATFVAAKAKLLADPNPSKYSTAIATYTTAIRSLTSAIASDTAASAGYRRLGKIVVTMQAQRAATISSVALGKAGVAQAMSLRNLICRKGL